MTGYGMIAFGHSGNWELSIDELVDESDKWSLQIESAVVSLQCGLSTLAVLSDLEKLLKLSDSEERDQSGSLKIGIYYGRPVTVTLDREYSDRCFITVGDSTNARFEVTLAGDDFCHFRKVVSQIVSELELE